jgi:TonB family protein
MTLIMAYTVLLCGALAAVAALGELLVRSRRLAGRWVWVISMSLVLPVTGFVMLAPAAPEPQSNAGSPVLPPLGDAGSVVGVAVTPAKSYLELSDVALTMGWVGASALLFLVIAVGQWRLARARRQARPGRLHGHHVMLTDDLGPAVAGVRQPVVFVPGWALALDDESQKLLLAHELEHARRRDTTLLMMGAGLTALVPWNPVVWWMARRLRVAVELDCDRRVLAANPGVRRYADLLLVAAEKPGFTASLLAAHLGEQASDLERRIEAMTSSRQQWRAMSVTAVVAVALAVASCEAPRPEPLAPGASVPTPTVNQVPAEPYFEFQVEKPVTRAPGSENPRYPEILRQAGVEGEVLVSFVVDETGAADAASFKSIKSTHDLFTAAVRQALPSMRFVPAEVGGRKVKQLVQQPFTFSIVGKADATANAGKKLAFVVRRSDSATPPSPNVVLFSAEGRELARFDRDLDALQEIEVAGIQSVEVAKGGNCSPMPCPLIRITLKKGYTPVNLTELRKRR